MCQKVWLRRVRNKLGSLFSFSGHLKFGFFYFMSSWKREKWLKKEVVSFIYREKNHSNFSRLILGRGNVSSGEDVLGGARHLCSWWHFVWRSCLGWRRCRYFGWGKHLGWRRRLGWRRCFGWRGRFEWEDVWVAETFWVVTTALAEIIWMYRDISNYLYFQKN